MMPSQNIETTFPLSFYYMVGGKWLIPGNPVMKVFIQALLVQGCLTISCIVIISHMLLVEAISSYIDKTMCRHDPPLSPSENAP